jgi:hypothetical protein
MSIFQVLESGSGPPIVLWEGQIWATLNGVKERFAVRDCGRKKCVMTLLCILSTGIAFSQTLTDSEKKDQTVPSASLVKQDAFTSKPDTSSCLAVYPTEGNIGATAAGAVFTAGLTLVAMHGERFFYLESRNISIHDIKTHYSKSELVKLEAKGIKIVVTTKNAVNVKAKTSDKGNEEEGSATADSVGGCHN